MLTILLIFRWSDESANYLRYLPGWFDFKQFWFHWFSYRLCTIYSKHLLKMQTLKPNQVTKYDNKHIFI